MLKIIKNEVFESMGMKEKTLLLVITNLTKAEFAMSLMNDDGTGTISPHDTPFAMSLASGFLFEALAVFSSIKKEARNAIEPIGGEFLDALNYISSKTSNKFTDNELRTLRNEGAFHSDVALIDNYIQTRSQKQSTEDIVLFNFGENHFMSPLVLNMLNHRIYLGFVDDNDSKDKVTQFTELSSKLKIVSVVLSEKWLHVENR